MMDEVKAGRINCIAVKDLSRFGRNYIETGEYLEKIFPFMGVRFISINDGLDNGDENSNADALIISLKNLINDVYAKDISQKIISSLRTKQLNGEHIGGRLPYGYKKSEERCNGLEIDEETAPVVRDIFRWKAEGVGDNIISRRLNEAGVPSPMRRRIEKGLVKSTKNPCLFLWRDGTISHITTNPVYIGHMTQGRTKQALCNNMSRKVQPKSEWIIVENTHSPIVDKAIFDKAQEARANNTNAFYRNYDKSKHVLNDSNVFRGTLFCADCGSRLIRKKYKPDSSGYAFVCPVKNAYIGKNCAPKYVRISWLYSAVLEAVKKKITEAADLTAIVERLNNLRADSNSENSIEKRMTKLQKEIKRLTNLKAALYETYADKLITESEYVYSKQRYSEKIDEARRSLETLQEESVARNETLTPKNKWLQAVKRFNEHDELSCEMTHTLINRIIVYGKNSFDIIWNFKNDYEAICEYVGEVGQ